MEVQFFRGAIGMFFLQKRAACGEDTRYCSFGVDSETISRENLLLCMS